MSSYEDRLKERRNKYKDPNNSGGQQESKQETRVSPADTSKYDERISQRKEQYSDRKVDGSYIDSFLKDIPSWVLFRAAIPPPGPASCRRVIPNDGST